MLRSASAIVNCYIDRKKKRTRVYGGGYRPRPSRSIPTGQVKVILVDILGGAPTRAQGSGAATAIFSDCSLAALVRCCALTPSLWRCCAACSDRSRAAVAQTPLACGMDTGSDLLKSSAGELRRNTRERLVPITWSKHQQRKLNFTQSICYHLPTGARVYARVTRQPAWCPQQSMLMRSHVSPRHSHVGASKRGVTACILYYVVYYCAS